MPAVDPQRLAQETRELLGLLGEPERFVRLLLDRLEFYSDQARRLGPIEELAGSEPAFRVRPPVLRSLRRAFAQAAQVRPKQALASAEMLWDSGWREARLLAAALLSPSARSAAAEVERWAATTDDRQVLRELAETGLAGLRQAHPAEFLKSARSWLKAARERPRLLALWALQAAAQDPGFQDLPGLLRALRGAASAVRGESRRALRGLIEALARRSPAEAASFLLQELQRQEQSLAPLVSQALPAFPERQRAVLLERLSAYRHAGIMPPD
jgi:hypothetical protein